MATRSESTDSFEKELSDLWLDLELTSDSLSADPAAVEDEFLRLQERTYGKISEEEMNPVDRLKLESAWSVISFLAETTRDLVRAARERDLRLAESHWDHILANLPELFFPTLEDRLVPQHLEGRISKLLGHIKERTPIHLYGTLDTFNFLRRSNELLMQALVIPGERISEGHLIEAVALPWLAILKEFERDPEFMKNFAQFPRKLEEFIAGAYEREGWPEVIITPPSGDRGRDVIASRSGFGSIRILDQVKAYSPGHLVTHTDVRAMLGVLTSDTNSSKAVITTTSDFEPGVLKGDEFSRFMPYRLETRNGEQLRQWLSGLSNE